MWSDGKAADGALAGLNDKVHVRVAGYPRYAAYNESLREFLRKARPVQLIKDGDDDVPVGRVAWT